MLLLFIYAPIRAFCVIFRPPQISLYQIIRNINTTCIISKIIRSMDGIIFLYFLCLPRALNSNYTLIDPRNIFLLVVLMKLKWNDMNIIQRIYVNETRCVCFVQFASSVFLGHMLSGCKKGSNGINK